MARQDVRDRASHAAPATRPSTTGSAVLWIGTVAYGASTVALLAVLSRHASKSAFTSVAALLGLAFVVSLVPAGTTLRSASLVADGRPPPALRPRSALLITSVSLAAAPLLAYLLHVAVLAAAIVTIQMVVAIPLAVRQGALLGRHRFEALGFNLVIEGIARFVLGAFAGILLGVTGLALGLLAGTAIALFVLPEWRSDVSLRDRPRTSLTATSAALALLGLFVQLDVLIAPSVVAHHGATSYDLAAVPSKGVYLALLAIGPLIFPSVRGRPDRRLVLGAASVALAFGVLCAAALVAGRHLIAGVLGRPPADPLEMGVLGVAMALAGVTGIAISAGIARGVRHPWPPLAVGIAATVSVWALRPGPLTFSFFVLGSQALATVLSVGNCMRRSSPMSTETESEPVMEILAEAGDPFTAAQAAAGVPALRTVPASGTGTRTETAHAEPERVGLGSVAVVIPTFRRPQLLLRLLDTVRSGTVVPDEIIVVDNDPDGSVDPGALPSGVQLVHAGLGMNASGARNMGWRASRSDICIFVDDDNEVDARCIEMLSHACSDTPVGVASPVIYSGDEGTIWCAGLTMSKWTGITRCLSIGEAEPSDPRPRWPTDTVADVYALRHEVLDRVGGLDDRAFPLCGEEFDLVQRVAGLGLERIVVRDARVRHYGNVSENPGRYLVRSTIEHGQERARVMARARVRVHRRHSRGLSRYTTLLVFVPLWAIVSAAACLRVKAPLAARLETVKAIASGLAEGYRETAPA
jgi:GT2 family glycosyltransferase